MNFDWIQKRCLEMFKRGKKDFLRRNVTLDETWIHHYTPGKKRSSAVWTAAGDSRPKRPKTQQGAGKVMASVFCNVHGILFIDYLAKSETINSNYYGALLDRLSAELKKKRPHMQKKKVLFHQDNAPCQLHENDGQVEWIKLWIASSPTIFSRSGPQRLLALCWLENMLQGKRFGPNKEVIADTGAYFESKDKSFYKKGIEKLEKR